MSIILYISLAEMSTIFYKKAKQSTLNTAKNI